MLGHGPVAARKSEALARAGAEIVRAEAFQEGLLDGCALVIGADAPEPALRALSAAAHRAGIPVNVVDRPALCSFISPAIVNRDPIIVAISSGGMAPVLARDIRSRIEALLPPLLGRLAALLASLRTELRATLPDLAARRRAIDRVLAGPAAALALAGNAPAAREAALRDMAAAQDGTGMVYLVGAGPGSPDLLTLRAHRLLGEADVIVHDARVSDAVLEMARRDAERVSAAPADAAPLLIRLSREGRRIVHLIPGDPGSETDRAALAAAGIAFEIVPGVLLGDPAAVDG